MSSSIQLERLYTLVTDNPFLNMESHMKSNYNKSRVLQGFISNNDIDYEVCELCTSDDRCEHGITIDTLYRLSFNDLMKLLIHYNSPTLTSRFIRIVSNVEHLLEILKLLQSQSSELYSSYYLYIIQRSIVSGNSTLLDALLAYSCPAYYQLGRLNPYLDDPLPSELVMSDEYHKFPCPNIDTLDVLVKYYDAHHIVYHLHLYIFKPVQNYMLYQIDETNAEYVFEQVSSGDSITPELVKLLREFISGTKLHKLCKRFKCYTISLALSYIQVLNLSPKMLASIIIDNDLVYSAKVIKYLRRSEIIYDPEFISIIQTIDTYKLVELYDDGDKLLNVLENLPFYDNIFFFLVHSKLSESSRTKLYNWSRADSFYTSIIQ